MDHEIYDLEFTADVDLSSLGANGFWVADDEGCYHPDHWEAWRDSPNPELGNQDYEYRIYDWRFRSKTDVARRWLYMVD